MNEVISELAAAVLVALAAAAPGPHGSGQLPNRKIIATTATTARISVKIAKVAYNVVTRRLPSDPPDDDDSSSMVADRSSPAEGDVGDAC